MKKILLSFLTVVSYALNSQTTLTQSFNEPKPGDLEHTYPLDTAAFTSGLPISVTGSNVIWNYTKLKAIKPELDNYYLSAASVSASANYPGCNLVQESNGVYTYFKSTTTPTAQTEILGLQTSTMSINFSNPGTVAKYPISFGSTSTDNLSGTFTFSVQGTCSGNITTSADGLGTLNLPQGLSYTNVLRIKSVQTITLTFGFFPIGTIKQTVYNYYKAGEKFPVLSINYSYFDVPLLSPTPIESGFATGSTNFFVTGLKENLLMSDDIILFPNPVESSLNIESQTGISINKISVFNQLGECVLQNNSGAKIDVSSLPNGIYLIQIESDKGLSRKKFIKN